jgi:hypothetical protein
VELTTEPASQNSAERSRAYTPAAGDPYVVKHNGIVVTSGTIAGDTVTFTSSASGDTMTATISADALSFATAIIADDGTEIYVTTMSIEQTPNPDTPSPYNGKWKWTIASAVITIDADRYHYQVDTFVDTGSFTYTDTLFIVTRDGHSKAALICQLAPDHQTLTFTGAQANYWGITGAWTKVE